MLWPAFPKLRIALSTNERMTALESCDLFLHGSGPGLVGAKEAHLAREAGKPYGFGGITLNDGEIKGERELLAGAKFIIPPRHRLHESPVGQRYYTGPRIEFGPDATFGAGTEEQVGRRTS